MNNSIKKFQDLMKKYLNGDINSKEFSSAFTKLFYEKKQEIIPVNEFKIIEEVWGYLDVFEPDVSKRALYEVLIDEAKFKNEIKKAIKNLEKLKNETNNY